MKIFYLAGLVLLIPAILFCKTDYRNEAPKKTTISNSANPLSYCVNLYSTSTFEWIESTQLGPISNESGNNGGYADFTDIPIDIIIGETIPVTLTTGYHSGGDYTEYWRILCDLNSDFDFDDEGEILFEASGANSVSGEMRIPESSIPGEKRVRVMMSFGLYTSGCTQFFYGEAEDYTFNVENDFNCVDVDESWNITDIGNPPLPNSVCYDTGSDTYYTSSSSSNISGQSDDFFFVHQQMCGVGMITAKVIKMNDQDPNAFSGLMMRWTLSDDARHVAIGFNPTYGYLLKTRFIEGQVTYPHHDPVEHFTWIRIERTTESFNVYNSGDGENWDLTHYIPLLQMGKCIEIGLVSTSSMDAQYNDSQFQFVEIEKELDSIAEPIVYSNDGLAHDNDIRNLIDLSNEMTLESPKNIGSLTVYPNPVSEYMILKFDENLSGLGQVRIYDISGVCIYHKEINLDYQNQIEMDASDLGLHNGKYYISLHAENKKTETRSFIVIWP